MRHGRPRPPLPLDRHAGGSAGARPRTRTRAIRSGPPRTSGATWTCATPRACRLGIESDLVGFHAFNITAADTLRAEPTEELLRTYLPNVEVRSPLPGNAAAWSGARATELLGFTAQHSWRDEG